MTGSVTAKMLSTLLADMVQVPASADRMVSGICADSRRVRPGDLFLACRGTQHAASRYIDEAIAAGAVAVVVEASEPGPAGNCSYSGKVPVFLQENLSSALGHIAARFHAHPARHLWMIGITGTNGKTSICRFIAQCFDGAGISCGTSGTLGNGLFGREQAAAAGVPGTTPDAVSLQSLYASVLAEGTAVMSMEVSSHGLDQHRVDVDDFDVAVFTNLSRDHLDYHGTMAAYAASKARLFSGARLKAAVINIDDPYSQEFIASLAPGVELCTYSLHDSAAAVHTCGIRFRPDGMDLDVVTPWGEGRLSTSLLGSFNAGNLLAALSVVLYTCSRRPDFDFSSLLAVVQAVRPVPGRMQVAAVAKPLVVVDYAHTPDGLGTALRAVREHADGRVCCLFGCGGDRDRGKRALMAGAAERLADRIVVTDDNPRSENSADIIADILSGFSADAPVTVRPDRADAIRWAINTADEDEIVLVAGKGHEDYQEIMGQRLPFSDLDQVRNALAARLATAGVSR